MQIVLRLPEITLSGPAAHYEYKRLGLKQDGLSRDHVKTQKPFDRYKTDTTRLEIDVEFAGEWFGPQQVRDEVDVPREMLAPGDVAISPDNDTCIVWNPMMPPERVKELYICVKRDKK
jgi:hypothetical protein